MFFANFNKIISSKFFVDFDDDQPREFQWTAHFALPFPLPCPCVKKRVVSPFGEFDVGIHGHLDRSFLFTPHDKESGRPSILNVVTHGKGSPGPTVKSPATIRRESLLSMATISEVATYANVREAYNHQEKKIDLFLAEIVNLILRIQTAAPFACAWMVSPPNLLDLEAIFVNIRIADPGEMQEKSKLLLTSPAFITGGNLQTAPFSMDAPDWTQETDPLLKMPYQLLGQAMTNVHRGSAGLAVVNAHSAIEILVQSVLSELSNRPLKTLMKGRSKEGTLSYCLDGAFRMIGKKGLKEEDEELHDSAKVCAQLRNDIVHEGRTVTSADAEKQVLICCRLANWLAKASGRKSKRLAPKCEAMRKFIMTTRRDVGSGFYWEMTWDFKDVERTQLTSRLKVVGPPEHS